MSTTRLVDGDTTFALGANSLLDPAQLTPGLYVQGMNVLNRGGIVQCRPGYRCLMTLPSGNVQATVLFRPKQSSEQMIFVIDGRVYVSDIPYTSFRLLNNVLLSEAADIVYWAVGEKSLERNPDGSVTFVQPRSVLILQDGVTPPVFFDGADSGHLRNTNPLANTLTPIGGPMAWVGDRLWVARGSKVFASDIADPLSFTDNTYLGGNPYFILPEDATGMAITPGLDIQQLLVFTANTTTLFQANIRERDAWFETPEFQKLVLPNTGCIAPRSIRAHYGLLWWFSNFGLTSLDAASLTANTSRLPYVDNEMSETKGYMRGDLSGIAVTSYENYLLVSVPYGSRYNKHTWVLDNSVADTLQGQAPVAWNSYWTGTFPVEWANGRVLGIERSFYSSTDADGLNRLWEAFLPERLDNGCPITWTLETRGYNGRLPLQDKEFRYAEMFFSELQGTVDVAVYWAGASRGPYKRILTCRMKCAEGSVSFDREVSDENPIYAFKKQSRRRRTQDARNLADADGSSCGVESPNKEGNDEAFQLFIVGSGPGAVRGIRVFMDPLNDDLSGKCEPDETDDHGVRFDGLASAGTYDEVAEALEAPPEIFQAVVTLADTVKGVTSVQAATGQSVISLDDAQKIAEATARAMVARELTREAPTVLGGVVNE